jgi:2-deoxy-D-gluconate 3-dehydrogenase
VILAGRDLDRLAAAKAQIDVGPNAGVDVRQVDVRSVDSIDSLAAEVQSHFGPLGILVNSAGGTLHKPALEVTSDEWDDLIDTHLRGTFFACQAFGRIMVEAGYGKIINLSSTWASTVTAGRSVYATAKAGVSHMTSALATEWAHFGVRVNAIAPTATTTPRVLDRMADDEKRIEEVTRKIPLGRLANPGDIVGAALFLASVASDFVTGHTLYVDGGWRASK